MEQSLVLSKEVLRVLLTELQIVRVNKDRMMPVDEQ